MENKTIQLQGNSFNYFVSGNTNPPLIFVHGWGASYKDILPNLEFLSKFFNVYYFSLPGHADNNNWKGEFYIKNYVDFLNDFIESLELKNITLMAESLGTLISLDYVAKYPGKVIGMIFISMVINTPTSLSVRLSKLISRMSNFGLAQLFIKHIKASSIFLSIWPPLICNKDLGSYEEISKVVKDGLVKISPKAYLQGYSELLSINTEDLLSKIPDDMKSHILFVYGVHDTLTNFNKKKWEFIPYKQVEIFDNSFHCPDREEKGRFQEVVHNKYINSSLRNGI